jgi:hypothetical protein
VVTNFFIVGDGDGCERAEQIGGILNWRVNATTDSAVVSNR